MRTVRSFGFVAACCYGFGVFAGTAEVDTNLPPADFWLTNAVILSAPYDFAAATTNGFEGLQAAALSSRLKVVFAETAPETSSPPVVVFSVEAPGHWASRDWSEQPMRYVNGRWECAVPVEDPDVPVVYFLQMRRNPARLQSALRLCVPRLAGVEMPTQLFWPFLEGFETGVGHWRLVAGPGEPEQAELSNQARNGQGAMRIRLPGGGRSRTVITTRVRGGTLVQHGATGIRLWMRAGRDPLQVRFTLIADAGTATQVVSPASRSVEMGEDWRAVDVPLSAFPKLPLGRVDGFAVECASDTPNECLLDDVQLLGPWDPDAL